MKLLACALTNTHTHTYTYPPNVHTNALTVIKTHGITHIVRIVFSPNSFSELE